MPVRVTKSWRPALRAIARIQLSGELSGWDFMWATYTRNQRKAVREFQQATARYADAYAKRYAPDARGVIVHSYTRPTPGYEIEVIAADGSTVGVYTVGHARLMASWEKTMRSTKAERKAPDWDDFFKGGLRVSDDFGEGVK